MKDTMEPAWENIKKEIDDYIIQYFYKIEWYYGENRAPFAYPPKLYIKKRILGSPIYVCELVMEDPGGKNIIIKEETPSLLPILVKKTINTMFHNFDNDVE